MKTKVFLIFAILFALCIHTACSAESNLSSSDAMQKVFTDIERTLGEEWDKQAETGVWEYTFTDPEGNTLIYYLCLTTCYDTEPDAVSGVDTRAICAVVDPASAASAEETRVLEYPALHFQKDGRSFLCWNYSPEVSYVIEYDPQTVSREDVFRMAESVYKQPNG